MIGSDENDISLVQNAVYTENKKDVPDVNILQVVVLSIAKNDEQGQEGLGWKTRPVFFIFSPNTMTASTRMYCIPLVLR